ncbi:RNase P modulator RnpM [Tepidibacillus fermentans]|uniref:YlxR domain-containing protein n=1 Tax=Tepidibacillus fermentans TaxID=1281767 RepID=A0A4R3KJU4_9BACI|nr:YlxR family protein [Tepidibacillus fermentans]TCS82982.1 hypothetical protein EDD72_10765 [Tepidibacillus fermentans]
MKKKKIPMRKCVACQEMKPKKELIRVVRTPEMEIMIDLTGKKSGRGAYLCLNEECLHLAKKKKTLEKALEVKLGEEIYQQLQLELEKSNEQIR